jgi:hypothetical protein
MNYELISKVLINVLLLSIFVSIFFFTYGTHIERLSINSQMNILANNVTDTFKITGNKSNIDLNNYINTNLLTPDKIKNIQAEDVKALSGNKPILKKVIIYIIIFTIIICIIIFTLVKSNKLKNIKEILIESGIILIFIALTEYSFLTFIGLKFISVDTNNVKLEVIKSLQKYSNSLN